MTTGEPRSCWQNCAGTNDDEVHLIDTMEDALAPLDEETLRIRGLITLFEACYHEADKEAESIATAIGAGRCPPGSNERPPRRKMELENARDILSAWCRNPAAQIMDLDVGGIPARELRSFLGKPNPLKVWQVERIVDRISHALDPNHPYGNLALSAGDPGQTGSYCPRDATFVRQTRETLLHDTVDGRESRISLGYAIDLLMPCGWDFVESVATILRAIGGDLHPHRPLACCARNVRLSPLCDRLQTIADTLNVFWRDQTKAKGLDRRVLASLGTPTPVKRWLAASFDKTIRLHLSQPFEMELF